MKRFTAVLLILMLLCSLIPAFAEADSNGELSGLVYILHTNDVHGHGVADSGTWGYQAISQIKKDLEEKGAEVLLFENGDFSQGTPLVNMDQGATAVTLMNAAGYTASGIGNHEFDWGIDNLLTITENAEFPILCANLIKDETGETIFAPNAVYDIAGHKIGVFGLDTPETMTKTNPDKVRGITFLAGEELYSCAQAQVDELTEAGCDIIICLGHLGVSDESTGNRSTDVLANTKGIDLFIDGHSHTVLNEKADTADPEKQAYLVQTGSYFANIGVEVIDAEGNITANLYNAPNIKDVITEKYWPCDPEVADIANTRNSEVEAELGTPFAISEVLLNGKRDPGVRTEETNLGDFSADAILWSARKDYSDEVVAALINGGGIRTSLDAGEITMMDMKTIFPFENTVAVLSVTGAELLEALEAATFTTPGAMGAFPQVSGIVYTIDTTVPYEQGEQYPDSTYYAPATPGSRVTIESVGDQPFDPEAVYMIATSNFVAAGGDTYCAFKYAYAAGGYDTKVNLEDALVGYVQNVLDGKIGSKYAEPAGRITVIR